MGVIAGCDVSKGWIDVQVLKGGWGYVELRIGEVRLAVSKTMAKRELKNREALAALKSGA